MYELQIAFAKQLLANGNLAAVDIVCRDLLEHSPGNAPALNCLGVVAMQIGEFVAARKCFTQAGDAEAQDNLQKLQALQPPPAPPPGPRYLLIKAWGYGFWSDVTQVLGSLFLAEITGRIPLVYWGAASRFGDGTHDAFTQYFQPVSAVSLDDLCRLPGATLFPPKWTHENLRQDDINKWLGPGSRAGAVYFFNRPETIAVSDFYIGPQHVLPWAESERSLDEEYGRLAQRYLRPQDAIIDAVEEFHRAHLAGAPFVAAHLRGSDKSIEDDDMEINNAAIVAALDAVDPDLRIFLLTDDARILADMKARYGARLVATDCQRTDSSLGLHHRSDIDRLAAGREVMIDTYLALRAQRFIGNASSNVAAMIGALKAWEPGSCTLFGVSMFIGRQMMLYVKRF